MKNGFKTTTYTLTNTDLGYNYANQESTQNEEDLCHTSKYGDRIFLYNYSKKLN